VTATPGQADELDAIVTETVDALAIVVESELVNAYVRGRNRSRTPHLDELAALKRITDLVRLVAITAQSQAAIAAQEPQPAPGVAMTPAVVRPSLASTIVLAVADDSSDDSVRELQDTLAALNQGVAVVAVRGVEALRTWEPQPAPELAAAMGETREVRDGYASLCEEFGDHSQSGQSARISLTVLNRHRKAAGLPGRRPAPAGERRDPYMQLLEERDELRVMLSTLTDRAEASKVITGDEADEYRTALNG
jgi:hypothetical protein